MNQRRAPQPQAHLAPARPELANHPGPAGAQGSDPGAGPATASPVWEVRFRRLEEALELFRVDAERFWNGALPVPPEAVRLRIQRDLRELRGTNTRGAVDQFRLTGVEARFNSMSELYGRRLREREEGRGPALQKVVAYGAPRPQHDPRAGIVFRDRLDPQAVEALWGGLAAAGGGARLELETFRTYLSQQLVAIRAKSGRTAVQFRVVHEEGKLKLKARPLDDFGPDGAAE